MYRKRRDRLLKNLDNRQNGFRPKHSTITQILQYSWKNFRCLKAKESSLSIHLDIAKAFVTINHKAILLKLMHFGLVLITKFSIFLQNIYQIERSVYVEDEYSSELTVARGRPQGSGFAVFMLAVYINELASLMEKSTFFADDTKNIGSQMNLFLLQNDLNNATKWSKENRLEFNNANFEAICFDVKSYVSLVSTWMQMIQKLNANLRWLILV